MLFTLCNAQTYTNIGWKTNSSYWLDKWSLAQHMRMRIGSLVDDWFEATDERPYLKLAQIVSLQTAVNSCTMQRRFCLTTKCNTDTTLLTNDSKKQTQNTRVQVYTPAVESI